MDSPAHPGSPYVTFVCYDTDMDITEKYLGENLPTMDVTLTLGEMQAIATVASVMNAMGATDLLALVLPGQVSIAYASALTKVAEGINFLKGEEDFQEYVTGVKARLEERKREFRADAELES